MAQSDFELINEVRALTDYHPDVMSDSTLQELIGIAKAELRADFGNTEFTFYEDGTHNADRALFWFTCIAAKVRAGEIAGIDITIDDLAGHKPTGSPHDFWFTRFEEKLKEANADQGTTGISQVNLSRDNRAYGEDA